MMPENEEQARERRASELAYAKGKRDAEVDSRLASHEARLAAINGSIERHARNVDALRASLDGLGDKFDGLAASLDTRAAIEKDRVEQIRTANEKQISNRTFWLGVLAITATILAAFIASSHGVHIG
jgi:uncharacterized coiled-coil protein SlyX